MVATSATRCQYQGGEWADPPGGRHPPEAEPTNPEADPPRGRHDLEADTPCEQTDASEKITFPCSR